mmetsp:Transcript_6407/g.40016  ORF Transcript_6407/g.40016 Transcript_6407/m.40016 type:complete len:167 (-) Transcript_6407:4634-5134(-)
MAQIPLSCSADVLCRLRRQKRIAKQKGNDSSSTACIPTFAVYQRYSFPYLTMLIPIGLVGVTSASDDDQILPTILEALVIRHILTLGQLASGHGSSLSTEQGMCKAGKPIQTKVEHRHSTIETRKRIQTQYPSRRILFALCRQLLSQKSYPLAVLQKVHKVCRTEV